MILKNYLPDTKDKNNFQDLVSDEIAKPEVLGVLLFLPTGLGKTKTTLDVIKKIDAKKVLWLVPSAKLRDEDVPDEFRKWKMVKYLNRTTLLCYASSHKITKDKWDLIIYDEAHHITKKVYDNIQPLMVRKGKMKQLFLTATNPSDEEKKNMISNLVYYKSESSVCLKTQMSVAEAKKRGFISNFKLIIEDVSLDPSIITNRYGKKMNEVTHYNYITSLFEKKKTEWNRKGMKSVALERSRFLGGLKSKERKVREITSKISKDKRYIVFCGNVDQANALSKHVYHYKSSDKWLKKFIDGDINDLYVVDSIDEGANLPELDGIIVVQTNSKSRKFIQRSGRALRRRKDKKHESFIILLRTPGTVDEKWVQNSVDEMQVKVEKKIDYDNHLILSPIKL